MSTEDIQLVHEILANCLNPDNNTRKQAEEKLNQMKNNIAVLLFCLVKVLRESTNLQVKSLAAVLARKIIVNDSGNLSTWNQLTADLKELIKTETLNAFVAESEKSIKFKIGDLVTRIAEVALDSDEKWPGLINLIISVFNGAVPDDSQGDLILASLDLLSHTFAFIYDDISSSLPQLVASFHHFFKSNSLTLKTKSIKAVTEILFIVRKKQAKDFRAFIFPALETTLKCLENPAEENNLKICLTAVADLAQAEANILRKHFADLFVLMGKVTEKNDFEDENVRELGFEVIMTLVERKPVLFSKDADKLKLFIEAIFKFALEIENEITEEWLTPTTESYVEEEFISEDKLATALSLIDRLIGALKSKTVLPFLSDIVLQLIKNEADWKFQYIALMTISQMVEYVDDIVHIENILPIIFAAASDSPNAKIRYGALQCLSQLSDHLHPHFQNMYSAKIIPVLLARVQNDSLRNQLQACDAIQTFLEHSTDQIAVQYAEGILDTIFASFLSEASKNSLKECSLNIISELTDACEKNFKPYAEKSLSILLNYFSTILTNKTHKPLYGSLLEAITNIGPKCEEVYIKFIPELVNAMISIQNSISSSTDPVANYLHNAWERIIPIIKDNYKNLAPQIIESTLKLVSNPPQISVSSAPEKSFNLSEILGIQEPGVKIEKKKIQIQTSETEEFANYIELINVMIETFSELFVPYIQTCQQLLLPLLSYEPNDSVRTEASNALPIIIEIVKKNLSTEELHSLSKVYVSELVKALEKEDDNAVIATHFDNISGIAEKTGVFLSTPELNMLFGKILETFDKVEKSRIDLMKQKDNVEEDLLKEKKEEEPYTSDDEEDEDDDILDEIEKDIEEIQDVLVSIADVIGALFKTHQSLTLEIVDKLLKDLLPKYFTEKSTTFETKMGLFIIDDMIEFLGQDLLANIWPDIAKLIINYADHKELELRQASLYGIGEFARQSTKDFPVYANDILGALFRALNYNKTEEQDEEEFFHARDNAVSSLGKIIKYQYNCVDLASCVSTWLNYLPLDHDMGEAQVQNELLCDILISNPSLVVGEGNFNLPKIIRILAKVYQTKYSSDEGDKKISNIMGGLKANSAMHEFIQRAIADADEKIKKKLAVFFS